MHRMIFEDFKKIRPDLELYFACPSVLMDAVKDHPFIDGVCPVEHVKTDDFFHYDTSHACARYEVGIAPLSDKHRSDIWAEHCGVTLTNHNMHINLTEEEIKYGQHVVKIASKEQGPVIGICPVSAMASKNLQPNQIQAIVKGVKELGLTPIGIHRTPVPPLNELNVPVVYGQSIRQWMGIINACDYIVSVDTSAFHFSGGIGKPMTAIFTWADGKVYGKYFDFVLVQKHRDNGDWPCGPCYQWPECPLTRSHLKPCLTEITGEMIMDGIKKMLNKWPYRT